MAADSSEPSRRANQRRQAADVFADALEQPSAARKEFVRRACGDNAELRAEVDTLLAALPKGELVLEASALQHEIGEAAAAVVQGHDRSGQTISHYRLEAFLGAGGMGEVYRAHDVALGRKAAVKLLRSGVDAQLRSRLLREAQTSARLEHPAVATFFESGTVDGVDFLAMEFVEGETLRSRLKKGPPPPNEALSMVASLAEAMVHSHAAGIVHRDIKPENIMVTEAGEVKLLDFGIAKEIGIEQAEAPDAKTVIMKTALTEHGMIIGTIGYMSPEQLRGDPVSESTDVFALGAVLYEVLSGKPAFPGQSVSQRIASVLSRDLPLVHVEGVHEDINTILHRALARDPADRYPNATAFLAELRRFATGDAVAALPNTLAILDLTNLARNPDDDWIGSGVAESLGVDLGRVEGLSLVPRNRVLRSSASLAGDQGKVDPVSLGLAVGCRWVLTGAFQRMGSSLRLTMRLIEVSTGKDMWSEKLDGSLEKIFEMQDRLTTLTTESLQLVLPEERDRAPVQDLSAFEHYAKARRFWLKLQRGSMAKAQENLERAIEVDPDYAPALAGLASMYAPGRWMQTGDPKDLAMAADYASRAVTADPNWADGHVWLGYARWRQNRLPEAIDALEKASTLEPENAMTHYFTGWCLGQQGRWEEAREAQQRALALEPKAPHILCGVGYTLIRTDDLAAARWILEKAFEEEQRADGYGWGGAGIILAECLLRSGKLEAAREQCMKTLEFLEHIDHAARSSWRSQALVALGRITLEQRDLEAARIAFGQAVTLVRSQPEGPGKGHLLVQALAGQARVEADPAPFEEASRLFEGTLVPFGAGMTDEVSLLELGLAARSLDREDEAQSLFARAREAGSREATEYITGRSRPLSS